MGGFPGYVAAIPIPSGVPGTRATLKLMCDVARKFLRPRPGSLAAAQSLLIVRTTAQRAVQHCAEKDALAEIGAIHAFCRDQIRYIQDMVEMETLQEPDKTLSLQSGDCDDKALLFCTMVSCIGYPSRFCAISRSGDDGFFSHVSGQALIPDYGWINAECIPIDDRGSKARLGWFPPDVEHVMLRHI